MPESERSASDVIQSYRKRRERMVPLVLGAFAVVLLVVGVFLIVIWFTGENPPSLPSILASDTPTPTNTHTPVPPTATATITLTLEPTETPTPSGPITYVVQEGDTLSSIAEEFGVSIDVLIAANPDIENAASIFVGQEIIIPPPDTELPTNTPLPETLVPGTIIEYVVRAGDTLQSIAAQFNSTAEAIAEENEMEITDVLFVGDVLKVPVGIATPTPTFTPNPFTATPTPRP